jgi:hypothetical protein
LKKHEGKILTLIITVIIFGMFLLSGCGSNGEGTFAGTTYEKGILTETTYESEYLNLRFELPDGYTMGIEAIVNELAEFDDEIIYQDAGNTLVDFSKANLVYEMFAATPDIYPSVYLMVEKLPSKDTTVKQYLDSLEKQFTGGEDLGYTIESKRGTNVVAGQSYTRMNLEINYVGIEVLQYFLTRKIDDRAVSFIITYEKGTEAEADKLLSAFSVY